MITILVSLMAMRGYFGGANMKIYIIMDFILAVILVCWWIIVKLNNIFGKKK